MRRAILFELCSLFFLAAAAHRVSAGQEKDFRLECEGARHCRPRGPGVPSIR
jgi:hypothetical protein